MDALVPSGLNVGFVSTRISGTDGVSLEIEKWADVLTEMGHECFYFAGECDRPANRSMVVPEAAFTHPNIAAISRAAFGDLRSGEQRAADALINPYTRSPEIGQRIETLRAELKAHLYHFVRQFSVDVLIPQNALAIPMNIPLGLALTDFIAETGCPTIAHHHDFFWERKRFLVNCVADILAAAFPPVLPSIRHVTISTWAASQLSLRTGVSPTVIPNVMDFDTPPAEPDGFAADLWADLGVEGYDFHILQPTRIVQRKGIEHAIELVKRMGLNACLVISHAGGDEGDAYEAHIRSFADLLGVDLRFTETRVGAARGARPDGRKVYALRDVYQASDLVTYPSLVEGFGNAFLEAVYYRKPVVVNNYPIYATDIKPKGFRVVEFDGFVSDDTVAGALDVLQGRAPVEEMVAHNYAVARQHFSYSVLRRRLRSILADFFQN
jgi:glycosyltransferase involved in cell wall biosynthesis